MIAEGFFLRIVSAPARIILAIPPTVGTNSVKHMSSVAFPAIPAVVTVRFVSGRVMF